MLQTLREAKYSDQVPVTVHFYRDLLWFQKFLPHFYGVCLYNHQPVQGTIQIDASLQGLGGRWGIWVYKVTMNLYLALRIWAASWAEKRVIFECDYEAVVSVVRSGKTRGTVLTAYARNISVLASVFDTEISVVHLKV